MTTVPTVAIVNTNPDLVRKLQVSLETAGFVVFVVHVEQIRTAGADLDGFLRQQDPQVIVYDVAPPFDQNWRFLEHLRHSPGWQQRQFVLTTVDEKRLHEVVGRDETVYEIVGLEEEIDEIIRAVKEASRARPTR